MELHHKDGNHHNNNLNNLEILCPNCHAQETNNSGAGILYKTEKINKDPKVKYYCVECGVELVKQRKTGLCMECYKKSLRTVERPDPEQLAQEIVDSSFLAVGRKYGVTDNTIRKWCIAYDIPKTKQELKK